MSVQVPTPGSKTRVFDLAVNAAGILAILLLGGALASNYFHQVPSAVITGLRWAGFGFILLYGIGSVIQSRAWLRDVARTRTARSGANSLVLLIAVLALVGLFNYLGTRYHSRVDLTRNHQFSLSPQTQKILSALKTDLKVTGFVREGDYQGRQLKDLVREYEVYTTHLKTDLVDPDREPGKVFAFRQSHPNLNARLNGLLIEANGRVTEAQSINEQDITNAILKATSDKEHHAYFLQGHGELSLDNADQEGLSQAKQALEKQNYKVDALKLFETKGKVPADAEVVIVAGARDTFMPQDVEALESYYKQGGKLMILLAPGKDCGLERILEADGIHPEKDLVVDPRFNAGGQPDIPVVQQYGSHPITQGLSPTVFPLARSISVATSSPAGVTVTSLAESSDQGFSRRDLTNRSADFAPGKDQRGPVKLAVAATVAATGSAKPNRLVVVGNAMFASNAFLRVPGNNAFFINAVNWVTDQDNLVAIPPKSQDTATVDMNTQQQQAVFWTSVAGAPGLLLLVGGLVWWRRRRS